LGGECKKASEILKNCHQTIFDHDIAIEGKKMILSIYFYQTKQHFRKTKSTLKRQSGLVSISPTFYRQLLHGQIPKAQKMTVKLSVSFCTFGICVLKSITKTLVKSTFGCQKNAVNSLRHPITFFGYTT